MAPADRPAEPPLAPPESRVKVVLRVVLALAMMGVGLLHFVSPEPFVRIVPAVLPAPLALVYVSGVAEIAGGVGLLIPRLRRAVGIGLIALYVAVFPANINMAIHEIQVGDDPVPVWALWARLPFQLVFIAWAYWVGVRSRPGRV
ncbi:DoxX family protein [Polyangium sorediatum]|uniref:DoxX family protein n=1 Tax=Polyangium sorediatum TaxID=889274 RepID=A0ABT6NKW7_9BACT|nr:DoxX family membrane protein [Polyangium sorediatum]MDI1428943.1 DoxX family protein [Polyangium sorediatum]